MDKHTSTPDRGVRCSKYRGGTEDRQPCDSLSARHLELFDCLLARGDADVPVTDRYVQGCAEMLQLYME